MTFTTMASVPRGVHHATWLTMARAHINTPPRAPRRRRQPLSFRCLIQPTCSSHMVGMARVHPCDTCRFWCVLVLRTSFGVEPRNSTPHPCPRHPTCPSWAFLAVNVSTSSQWCSSQEWVGRAPISHSPPVRLLGGTTLHERGVIRSTFPRCGRVSPWLSRAHLVFVVMQPCCTLRDVSRVLHILERCVICAVVRTRWSCRHRRSP